MSTPKGMTCHNFTLTNHDQMMLYHTSERIILQLRHKVATEEDILSPSFKVAVELSSTEAIALAAELLSIAAPQIQTLTKTVQDQQMVEDGADSEAQEQ